MKALQQTLMAAVILSTSLALSGNVATAAATQAHKTAAKTPVTHHVASVRRPTPAQYQVALPNIFGALFGLPMPPPVTGHAVTHVARGTTESSGSYDPTFDTPTPDTSASDAVGWAAEQNAQDAAAMAMQEEDQSLNDLDASIAAAEEQNDEANAATQQTLINNGM